MASFFDGFYNDVYSGYPGTVTNTGGDVNAMYKGIMPPAGAPKTTPAAPPTALKRNVVKTVPIDNKGNPVLTPKMSYTLADVMGTSPKGLSSGLAGSSPPDLYGGVNPYASPDLLAYINSPPKAYVSPDLIKFLSSFDTGIDLDTGLPKTPLPDPGDPILTPTDPWDALRIGGKPPTTPGLHLGTPKTFAGRTEPVPKISDYEKLIASMPDRGKKINTASHGSQTIGTRLNGSPKGLTITNDPWFNQVRGL